MTGVSGVLSSYGATPPATLVYYLDASAQGAFPGASITSSATFNGTTKQLAIPASSALTLGTSNHTIEFWMNQPSRGTYSVPWAYNGTAAQFASDYYVLIVGSSSFSLSLGNGAGGWEFILDCGTAPSLNTWHHYAIVRNGTTFTVYVDGTSVGTTTSSLNISAQTNPMYIGYQSSNGRLTGNMSNLRIVIGTALYTTTFTPPTATLRAVAGTQLLLPMTANPFMDISPNLFTVDNSTGTVTSVSAPSLTAATTDVTGNYALSYSNTSARISWASTQGGIFSNAFSGDAINAYITGGPNWSTSRSYTVFMGYKLTGTSNYGRLLNSNTANPDWLMGGYASKSKAFNANGTTINLSGPVDTTWHLDWARFNKTTSKGDLFSVTSVQPTSTPAYTTTNAGIGAFNQLKLFSKSDGNECAAGDIAFVRIWDGAMTTAQMQAEWTAFHARVGF